MKKNKNNKIYITIIILLVALIICLIFKNNISLISKVNTNVFSAKSKYKNKILVEENKELKREINDLKSSTKIDSLLSDKKEINASIIYRSAPFWHDYITINKGKKDNIKNGYAVINNDGLLGEIIKVYSNFSKVRLITNKSNNYISAKFSYNNKEYYGIIKNYDIKTNILYLENVIGDLDNKILGINIVTSGLSSDMPSGLLIGKIIDIKKDNYNLSNIIKIKMSADINDLKILKVVGKK
ncbi:MAG: rod shape-determining protein MreC [Bacilli bacterium]|nr:rod shape-determining protein MreC [Bacilli bacterium]